MPTFYIVRGLPGGTGDKRNGTEWNGEDGGNGGETWLN